MLELAELSRFLRFQFLLGQSFKFEQTTLDERPNLLKLQENDDKPMQEGFQICEFRIFQIFLDIYSLILGTTRGNIHHQM